MTKKKYSVTISHEEKTGINDTGYWWDDELLSKDFDTLEEAQKYLDSLNVEQIAIEQVAEEGRYKIDTVSATIWEKEDDLNLPIEVGTSKISNTYYKKNHNIIINCYTQESYDKKGNKLHENEEN